MGLEFIKNAGVDHKINFIQSDGLQALDKLLSVCYPLQLSLMFFFFAFVSYYFFIYSYDIGLYIMENHRRILNRSLISHLWTLINQIMLTHSRD